MARVMMRCMQSAPDTRMPRRGRPFQGPSRKPAIFGAMYSSTLSEFVSGIEHLEAGVGVGSGEFAGKLGRAPRRRGRHGRSGRAGGNRGSRGNGRRRRAVRRRGGEFDSRRSGRPPACRKRATRRRRRAPMRSCHLRAKQKARGEQDEARDLGVARRHKGRRGSLPCCCRSGRRARRRRLRSITRSWAGEGEVLEIALGEIGNFDGSPGARAGTVRESAPCWTRETEAKPCR